MWKDAKREKEAANLMKMTAQDLLEFGVIDKIIPEHHQGAHIEPEISFNALKTALSADIETLLSLPRKEVIKQKHEKFRAFGVFDK